jgi:hypothetical protein
MNYLPASSERAVEPDWGERLALLCGDEVQLCARASSPFTHNYNLIHAGCGCRSYGDFLKLCELVHRRRLRLGIL